MKSLSELNNLFGQIGIPAAQVMRSSHPPYQASDTYRPGTILIVGNSGVYTVYEKIGDGEYRRISAADEGSIELLARLSTDQRLWLRQSRDHGVKFISVLESMHLGKEVDEVVKEIKRLVNILPKIVLMTLD